MVSLVRSRTILQRQLETRAKIWPTVTNNQLWMRKERDGFATIPRAMPLIIDIMDDLAGKGTPVGRTYLELWCRLYDEGFLVLNRPEEMAFHAGFSGQRAVRTWRDRVKLLAKLKFIDLKAGPLGELSYALFWNPYHALKWHNDHGRIQSAKWLALEIRTTEVKATDLGDNIYGDQADPNAADSHAGQTAVMPTASGPSTSQTGATPMPQSPDENPANDPRLIRIRYLQDQIGMYSHMVETMKAATSPSDEYLDDTKLKEDELNNMKAELAGLTTG